MSSAPRDNVVQRRKSLAEDIQFNLDQAFQSERPDSKSSRIIENGVSVLGRFASVFDVVASFDPVHAALPWAAARAVIGVSNLIRQLTEEHETLMRSGGSNPRA
jgi:hypothetical protein